MGSIVRFINNYYTLYTMFLVIGSGLFAYFVDYREMKRKEAGQEGKISKAIGLTYIFGGILLYVFTMFTG